MQKEKLMFLLTKAQDLKEALSNAEIFIAEQECDNDYFGFRISDKGSNLIEFSFAKSYCLIEPSKETKCWLELIKDDKDSLFPDKSINHIDVQYGWRNTNSFNTQINVLNIDTLEVETIPQDLSNYYAIMVWVWDN